MRPRLILLLLLATGTIAFVAFLVTGSEKANVACGQAPCGKKPAAPESGGGEREKASFNHLFVSTIK